jgi:phosphoribosyl 1,2-cyclic phosphodiesterase
MIIRFWGVRGSLPTPLDERQLRNKMHRLLDYASTKKISTEEEREKILKEFAETEPLVIGGNTACVEVQTDDKIIIFDMGSGIKKLGNFLMKDSRVKKGLDIHIFLSHTHWDHIMGFPFFMPAYMPQNKLTIYGVHPEINNRLEHQQDLRFFPVKLTHMSSKKEFVQLEEEKPVLVGDIMVNNTQLLHPGKSFAYSVEHNSKKVVFATDSEYKEFSPEAVGKYVNFFRESDLLIFDAQYSIVEAIHKEDWGHSSPMMGIDLAQEANVKRIALFHHEPENDDEVLVSMLKKALRYRDMNYADTHLEVFLAKEGLEITL